MARCRMLRVMHYDNDKTYQTTRFEAGVSSLQITGIANIINRIDRIVGLKPGHSSHPHPTGWRLSPWSLTCSRIRVWTLGLNESARCPCGVTQIHRVRCTRDESHVQCRSYNVLQPSLLLVPGVWVDIPSQQHCAYVIIWQVFVRSPTL